MDSETQKLINECNSKFYYKIEPQHNKEINSLIRKKCEKREDIEEIKRLIFQVNVNLKKIDRNTQQFDNEIKKINNDREQLYQILLNLMIKLDSLKNDYYTLTLDITNTAH